MRFRRTFVVIAATIGLSASLLGTATAAPAAPRQQSYYLSLGDSLAFGYQPNLVATGDLNATDYRGYAEDFAALRPRLTLVNYGCPGETTTSILNGGCPWTGTLHDSYGAATSQAAAAEAFLRAHHGRVSLISVTIGSNDLLGLVRSCGSDPNPTQCITNGLPATLATLGANYSALLARVTALAPTARIVLFNYYNPLALAVPGSDRFAAAASNVVATLATDPHTSVADAFRAINHSAGSPAEGAFVCALTWECTPFADVHPNDLGYGALTVAMLRAVL